MSFDLNLTTVCNHRNYKEPVQLNIDRRTIRVAQPISASNVQVFATGDLVPSSKYSLVDDPNEILVSIKMIVFNKKWQATEDSFEVSYNTLSNYCTKCVGLKIIDDISYNVSGDFYALRNENLLLQNMEKFTVTERQSNPFHSFIGTGLVGLLGTKINDQSYLTTKIMQEINSTLTILKNMQSQYVQAGREVTAGELLDTINSVQVKFDANDPTILRADISCSAKSGKPAELTQYLKRVA